MIRAIYPGSFDPITNGHLDIIYRASKIFDKIIVVVAENSRKISLFTTKEKVDMIQNTVKELENVEVQSFKGLLIECVRSNHANIILRGMRAISDFEYESQFALINKKMAPEIETIFMVTSTRFSYLNSSIVKEIASLNGCIKELVPPYVEEKLKSKYNHS
ncbi:MAG TPA: pantetheine-phosphate adenylyltransferase [Atribacterota bacterium]|nr:pantetheine-phosphate adenylyltransferase [Atribacterota bacterium]HOR42860.1 pantetheine-phosphate adenylyltransferase [Atribacterota bacterium]HPK86541.1 pantetheine-phosphate adenylyltransferase [Atribacterota bacterium]